MTRHSSPLPKLFLWILSHLSVYEEMFSITRDFAIEYGGICQHYGRIIAFLWLAWNTLKAVLFYLCFLTKWRTVMFRNNLKIALRILKRHKGYSFINIAGLAAGMACFILMMFYVSHELSFDKFHERRIRHVFPLNRIPLSRDCQRHSD